MPALPVKRRRRFVRRNAHRSRRQSGISLHGVAFLSGFDTPSLPAQGQQRRPFRIPTMTGTSPPNRLAIGHSHNSQRHDVDALLGIAGVRVRRQSRSTASMPRHDDTAGIGFDGLDDGIDGGRIDVHQCSPLLPAPEVRAPDCRGELQRDFTTGRRIAPVPL